METTTKKGHFHDISIFPQGIDQEAKMRNAAELAAMAIVRPSVIEVILAGPVVRYKEGAVIENA